MAAHPTSADAVVIGAGAWGLAAALRLARDGAQVVVVDDGGPAATDVAAGMIAPWSELEDDGEHALHDARRAAAAAWPGFADALADAAHAASGYAETGAVYAAARPAHAGALRRLQRLVRDGGERCDWLSREELLALEPALGPSVAGGLHLPGEHQAEPAVVRAALRGACARAGVRVVAGAASRLVDGGVELADGARIAALETVLAAGAGCVRLADAVPVRPLRGEILTLAPRDRSGLAPLRIVRTPDVYLVPRPDGRLVVGATSEEGRALEPGADAVHDLLAEAFHTVPDLRALAFAGVAVGLRPQTPDGLPALGRDARGVVWASGAGRHGILLLPLVGDAVAAAVAGTPPPAAAAPFSPLRLGESAWR
jgi:glycine oxidase